MLYTTLSSTIRTLPSFEQTSIIIILIIAGLLFLALLLLGVRKSFILKAENERLSKKSSNLQSADDNKVYKDFTEGHLYDSY